MIARLHYITQDVDGISHAELVEEVCKAGVDWVQLRLKKRSEAECLEIAGTVKEICNGYNARLVINDFVEIAKRVKADGVHLGKEDMAVTDARKYLGAGFLIGGSTNTAEDAEKMIRSGADYIGMGPYRFTSTRENLNPIRGLEGIRNNIAVVGGQGGLPSVPVIAIGGITPEDVNSLLGAGVYGVAVSSAINHAPGRSDAVRKFLSEINRIPWKN